MIIHYNCTIGSFLLHSFLLVYHPYPPSFHEMIFILVLYRDGAYVCITHNAISNPPNSQINSLFM